MAPTRLSLTFRGSSGSAVSGRPLLRLGPSNPALPANPAGTPISSALGVNLCPASPVWLEPGKIPAPGTEDDDHNPPRIRRAICSIWPWETTTVFHGDRFKWSARITVINLANQYALYNFLSTFSGTHYVTPRSITGQIGFHF